MNGVVVSVQNLLATLVASVIVAGVALVFFVLPAEYGLDPSGVGAAIGLKGMSGYSVNALTTETAEYREDYAEFPLAPFESIEYKYTLAAGASMIYSWTSEAEVIFDFHTEEEGTEPEDSVSFSVGQAKSEHGTYVAPFPGIHGWFWENRTQDDVTIRLRTTGYYTKATTFGRAGARERPIN